MKNKNLSRRELEIMNLLWSHGPLFVKDMLEFYDDPKPHFSTISTFVRGLDEKGFVSHKEYGNSYQYYAVVSKEEYGKNSIYSLLDDLYSKNTLRFVSALIQDDKISADELKELIEMMKKGN